MKKCIALLVTIAIALGLAACGEPNTDDKTIKVGASITPHAEILKVAGEVLEKEGYQLEIVEYDDYVLPNTATESGDLDANYFQHKPYLDDFNEKNGTHLVSVGAVHYEPFGIYAGKTAKLEDLQDGAVVSIPNDGTNEARALYLLEAQGLITLKKDVGFTATVIDIESNPKNLEIKELAAPQLVRSLQDVDISIINGNYAIGGGLQVGDALCLEDSGSDAAKTYANILAVKEGSEESPKIQALYKALTSEEVKSFIAEKYSGAVVAIF